MRFLELPFFAAIVTVGNTDAFFVQPRKIHQTTRLHATEEWRQYVPLVVSGAVMVDILLGSPAANAVLGIMRPKDDTLGDATTTATTNKPIEEKLSGERVDTQEIAQAAIDKAQNTLELRKFLDESKTDYDKIQEIQRKVDEEAARLDAKLRNNP